MHREPMYQSAKTIQNKTKSNKLKAICKSGRPLNIHRPSIHDLPEGTSKLYSIKSLCPVSRILSMSVTNSAARGTQAQTWKPSDVAEGYNEHQNIFSYPK